MKDVLHACSRVIKEENRIDRARRFLLISHWQNYVKWSSLFARETGIFHKSRKGKEGLKGCWVNELTVSVTFHLSEHSIFIHNIYIFLCTFNKMNSSSVFQGRLSPNYIQLLYLAWSLGSLGNLSISSRFASLWSLGL